MTTRTGLQRLLILAHDASSITAALEGGRPAGMPVFDPVVCADMAALVDELGNGADLLIVAAPCLAGDASRLLSARLRAQPAWSDLALLVLVDGETDMTALDVRRDAVIHNRIVLNWPQPAAQFGSIVCALLRARAHQYALRQYSDANGTERRRQERAPGETREAQAIDAPALPSCAAPSGPAADSPGSDLPVRGRARSRRRAWLQAKKMDAIARMSCAVTHEFNNLLHVINGNIDLLDRVSDDPRQKRLAGKIKKAVGDGTRLLDSLLVLQNKGGQYRGALDLPPFIDRLAARLREEAGPRVALHIDGEAKLPPVACDAVALETALLALVANARAAMPDGGTLALRLAQRTAAPGLLPAGQYCVISLSDTGPGIDLPALEYVFDPFYRGPLGSGGRGLGLSHAYAVARQAGGGAEIDSAPGRGCCVTLWLALAAT